MPDPKLEEEVRRDLARAHRWEGRHAVFITLCGLALGIGYAVLMAVREWKIWN